MAVVQPAGTSGDEMSEGGRTSHIDGASLCRVQLNWPTGGGVVGVDVDVEVVVEEDVEVLLVVVLPVVGAMVDVVVGAIVVVVDVVLADVDTRVLVPPGDSVAREGELFGESHPVATRTKVMIGSVPSLAN